jgi:hypothetical protein
MGMTSCRYNKEECPNQDGSYPSKFICPIDNEFCCHGLSIECEYPEICIPLAWWTEDERYDVMEEFCTNVNHKECVYAQCLKKHLFKPNTKIWNKIKKTVHSKRNQR